jgi:hypothetical protein
MNFSLTQAGNYGQFIAMALIMTGMSKEDAEVGSAALATAFGVFTYLISWGTAWYGRYRQGDVTVLGVKK